MAVNAVDSQLIEQLKWTSEQVCTAFHVPPYMIGAGTAPTYNNIEALNQQYYAQCLQGLIESLELCLDEGLGLPRRSTAGAWARNWIWTDLLRMDTASRVKAAIDGIGGGLFAPDEARKGFDLKKLPGGSSVYMQQQMWSLEQLSKRTAPADMPAAPACRSTSTPGASPGRRPAARRYRRQRQIPRRLFREGNAHLVGGRMKPEQISAFAGSLAPIVKDFVAAKVAPLVERVAALEARPPAKDGEPGQPGKDADQVDMEAVADIARRAAAEASGAAVEPIRKQIEALEAREPQKGEPGLPGKDADTARLDALEALTSELDAAVSELAAREESPVPKDGKDAAPEQIAAAVAEQLKANPPKTANPSRATKAAACAC
jgi:hypothetical protein